MRSDKPFVARVAGGVTPVLSLIAAALLPKCPLCIAVWLSGLGIGAASAFDVAPFVRPALLVLAISSLAAWVIVARRRLQARADSVASCGCSGIPPRSA